MRKINQYLLVKKIGVGAYGDVFLAVKPDQEDFTKTQGAHKGKKEQD